MYNKHTHLVSVFPTSQHNEGTKWHKWLKTIWAKEDSKGVNSTKKMLKRWEANTATTMDSEQKKLQYNVRVWYHVPQSNLLWGNAAGRGNVNIWFFCNVVEREQGKIKNRGIICILRKPSTFHTQLMFSYEILHANFC